MSSPTAALQDVSMQDIMIELRGKYRTVCAKLGITDRMFGADVAQPAKPSLDY